MGRVLTKAVPGIGTTSHQYVEIWLPFESGKQTEKYTFDELETSLKSGTG
jgi:hypothetical protein